MPTYQVSLPDGSAYHIQSEQDLSDEQIHSALGYDAPEPQSSAMGAFARGAGANAGKGLGAAGGAIAGGEGGAALGTFLGGPVGTLAGGILGSVGGAIVGGFGGQKVQEGIQGQEYTDAQKAQLAIDEQQHPIASGGGQMLATLPSMIAAPELEAGQAVLPLARLASQAASPVAGNLTKMANAALGGAVFGGGESGGQVAAGNMQASDIPGEVLKSATTLAPLALIPGGKTAIGKILGKGAGDATALAVTNSLYDHLTGKKEFDPSTLAGTSLQNMPGFMALNALTAALHGHAMGAKVGNEPAIAKENLSESIQQAPEAINGRTGQVEKAPNVLPVSGTGSNQVEQERGNQSPEGVDNGPTPANALPVPGSNTLEGVAETSPGVDNGAQNGVKIGYEQDNLTSPTKEEGISGGGSLRQSAPVPEAGTENSVAPSLETGFVANDPNTAGLGPQAEIRNAATDVLRREAGLPERDFGQSRSREEAKKEADHIIKTVPGAVDRLVTELNASPRSHRDYEVEMLRHATAEAKKANDAAAKAKIAADDAGDPNAKATATALYEQTQAKLGDVILANESSGKVTARELAARREYGTHLPVEDLGTTLLHLRAKVGRKLTSTEEKDVATKHAAYEKATQALESHVAKQANSGHVEAVKNLKTEVAQEVAQEKAVEARKTASQKQAERNQKRAAFVAKLDAEAQAAHESFRRKMGQSNSMFAGLDTLPEMVTMLKAQIAKGLVKSDALFDFMDQLGFTDKDLQKQALDAAKQSHDEELKAYSKPEQATPETLLAKAREQGGELSQKLVKDLYKAHIKANLDKPLNDAELSKRVHADVAKLYPDATERQVRDAFSNYGKTDVPSKDELSKQTAEMRAQVRLASTIEDVVNGKAPKRTGFQRGKPSDIVRERMQQVRDLMKKMGISSTKEGQLTDSRQAVINRLNNQIRDYERVLSGEMGPRSKPERLAYTAEMEALKSHRDQLALDVKMKFGPSEAYTWNKNAERAARTSEQYYKRRISTQDFAERGKPQDKFAASESLKEARADRNKAKAEFEALKDAANPKLTPEQAFLKQYKGRLERSIAENQRKVREGDFAKKAPREIALDQEAKDLKYKQHQSLIEVERAKKKIEMSNRSTAQKIGDTLVGWRRGFLLSGYHVLAKLSAAALARHVVTPIDELAGSALNRISPTLAKVASMAPREGSGFDAHQEAKAITDGVLATMKHAGDILRTGQTPADSHSGKPNFHDIEHYAGKSVIELFGNLHAFLKSSAKEAEFSRSFQKRAAHEIAKGNDPKEPDIQTRLMVEAYKDAKRAVFQQKNVLSSMFTNAITQAENSKQFPVAGKAIAYAARTFLPIVTVPTNFAAEAINRTPVGIIRGALELRSAIKAGIDSLHPDDADAIMRHFKQGTVGSGLMLLGYLAPQIAGGYYQPGEKRKEDDLHPGDIGFKGSHLVMHNSAAEVITMGATVRKVADHMFQGHPEGFIKGMAQSFLGLAAGTPFIRTPYDLGSIAMGKKSDQSRAVGSFTQGVVVPRGLAEFAQDTDSVASRKTRDVSDYIKAGIPGLRQTLPVRKLHE